MSDGTAQPSTSPDPPTGAVQGFEPPPKKKQKRNKPTLSCEECVERKTKVSDCFCAAVSAPRDLSDIGDCSRGCNS
jgi:hypothetical protein